MQKFAAFDIDGTIIRWQLYHAICDELARKHLISPDLYQTARGFRMNWKQRASPDAFKDYEAHLIAVFDQAILEITYDQFMSAVHQTFDTYKDQTYTFTRDLIRRLKAEGYLLFAISASQKEIVGLLANYYGFDDYGGSTYEHSETRFTGTKWPLLRQEKPKLLIELVAKYSTSLEGSIAVGDSDSDIPMLQIVERPIAFNPNKLLLEHATQKGWEVVVERKDVVYRLNQSGSNYQLQL